MKIGIIGAGNIGGTIGMHWVEAGHNVMFACTPSRVVTTAWSRYC